VNCQICKREIPDGCLEKHHLVPKSSKGRITITVCINCGDQLHKLFTNKELEKKYNTIEALLATEKIQKWAMWIGKKKDYSVPQKSFKRTT
jgi:hypothetical protein